MQGVGRWSPRTGLLTRQSEVADKYWFRRIAQIIDLRHARRAPAYRTGNQVSDTRVAFPPVLVRVPETADDDGQTAGLRRVCHIPDFVRAVAEIAQHIELAFVPVRK